MDNQPNQQPIDRLNALAEKVRHAKAILQHLKNTSKQNKDITKVSDTPTPQTPIEKAKALLRKTDNKYTSYMDSKLLPSLED